MAKKRSRQKNAGTTLAVTKPALPAELSRTEDQRADEIRRALEEHRLLSTLAGEPSLDAEHLPWPKRRAMLFVNAKSGPKADSLLQLRNLVEMLGRLNVQADVRVKLSKKQARAEARQAAKDGYDVVIAAGGDGTVETIARGLVDTGVPLGIIPLGTYNNIAFGLGIPTEPAAACALIALGTPRPIDVGCVWARGLKKPRVFMESATIGLGAALTPIGQHAEKGRWQEAAAAVPVAQGMELTPLVVRLDDSPTPQVINSLLLTASIAPRAGAALMIAPEARVDDGQMDLAIYADWGAARLAQHALEMKMEVGPDEDPAEVQRSRAREVRVWTQRPLPVAADSKVVGVTPACIQLLPKALLAIVGNGPALTNPTSQQLMDLCRDLGTWVVAAKAEALPDAAIEAQAGSPLQAAVPMVGQAVQALESARTAIPPVLAALGGVAAAAVIEEMRRRRS